MNAHPAAGSDHYDPENLDPETFDYDPGYPQTYEGDFDNAYDRVTARDIADLLHHLAEMRCNTPAGVINTIIDPAERAAFLSRKADLFTRIARRAERTRIDDYSRQVRQMAADAHAAAEQAKLQLPQPPVGPNQRRTSDDQLARDGARSQENSGASSG
jgi:hypothetical protein